MKNFIQTNLKNNDLPIMIVDVKGYAHCVWKNKNTTYSKFNGSNWEFLNDNKFVPVPEKAQIPKNGLSLDGNNYPYLLYAIGKNTEIPWGNSSYLHLCRWNGSEWILEQNYVADKTLYGASLVFYDDDLYISVLIKHASSYLLSIILYQNGYFNQLNTLSISALSGERSVLLKKVDTGLCCFWDNYDDANKWIEHAIYYPGTNTFEYHSDKKIQFTNDNIPITGFDFSELN